MRSRTFDALASSGTGSWGEAATGEAVVAVVLDLALAEAGFSREGLLSHHARLHRSRRAYRVRKAFEREEELVVRIVRFALLGWRA